MVCSWLFSGPLLSRKTVFGPFSLLFRGFFVAPVSGKFYAYSPWNSLLKFSKKSHFLRVVERTFQEAGLSHDPLAVGSVPLTHM